jgi:crossover junction endodeoxyribonuclease RuvC
MSGPHVYVGIDPGCSGGIAIKSQDGWELFSLKEPGNDVVALKRALALSDSSGAPLLAVLEEVGGFIGKPQPGSAMFKFGTSYGRAQGILEALHIPYRLVKPQRWQTGISGVAGLKGAERKRALCAEARRRHPDIKVTMMTCDSILLADFASSLP